MNAEITKRRTTQRRERRAVHALVTGAPAREIAQLLRVRKTTVERFVRALGNGQQNDNGNDGGIEMSERVPAGDERSLVAKLNGEAVVLTPMPDGSIKLTRRGEAVGVSLAQLEQQFIELGLGDADVNLSDDQLVEEWEAWRRGEPHGGVHGGADLAGDHDGPDIGMGDSMADLSDEQVFQAWRAETMQQIDLALEVGDHVTWGSGQGTGYGILQEIHTDTGMAVVELCELTDDDLLSPTAKKVMKKLSDLRATDKELVGEKRQWPELSTRTADLAGGEDLTTLTVDEIYARVAEEIGRMEGGFGA